MEVSVSGDGRQMRSTSNPSLHVVHHHHSSSSHKNASNSAVGSNGSIASLGDSMGSVGSLSGSTVPRSGIKMGTLLSPGNRSTTVVSHNQRIRPIVRPLDPAELLGGVLGDVVDHHHHHQGPKRSSSEVLTKTGYDHQHRHHRGGGSSKDMLSTNFGRLTVNDRSEEESDDSDELTSEESEWEQEVTPSGNVNYIGKTLIFEFT